MKITTKDFDEEHFILMLKNCVEFVLEEEKNSDIIKSIYYIYFPELKRKRKFDILKNKDKVKINIKSKKEQIIIEIDERNDTIFINSIFWNSIASSSFSKIEKEFKNWLIHYNKNFKKYSVLNGEHLNHLTNLMLSEK